MSVAGEDPVERTRLLLRDVPKIDARVRVATRQAPAADSGAARDQDRFEGIGSYPWVFVGQILGVALDHAKTWAQLLDSHGIPRYAHLTLLRTTLEAAVTARWLLSAVPPEARVAAAVSMLEQDLVDWERLAESFPGTVADDHSASYSNVLREFRDQVAAAGLQIKRPPSASDRVRDFGVPLGGRATGSSGS